MSKPSLHDVARRRKAGAWLALQHRASGSTLREYHQAVRDLERITTRRAPPPRMPFLGRVVAKRKVRELEGQIEELELDGIADASGIGVMP